MMHLGYGVSQRELPVRVVHISQLLAGGLAGITERP
jgi:hypothetical protein